MFINIGNQNEVMVPIAVRHIAAILPCNWKACPVVQSKIILSCGKPVYSTYSIPETLELIKAERKKNNVHH